MTAALQRMCEQFIENRDRVKAAFKWDSSLIYPACANLFCAAGKEADAERLAACRQLIREHTGFFSSFRGNVRPALVCLLSMEDGAEEKLARVMSAYQLLKQEFWGSGYLALVAYFLADQAGETETEGYVARGKALYRRMKKEHPFLTSEEDSVFAVMMAFSEKSDDALIEDTEACYRLLRQRFHSANAVQTASHVLALADGTPEEKAGRVIELYDALRRAGCKYGRDYELAVLAALAIQKADISQLADDVAEADAFLRGQQGYGFFGAGRRARLMHAAMIAADSRAPLRQTDAAALTGTLAMIAAQQTAAFAAMAGASAAASAAASH